MELPKDCLACYTDTISRRTKAWDVFFTKYLSGSDNGRGCFVYETFVLGNDRDIMNDTQDIIKEDFRNATTFVDLTLGLSENEASFCNEFETTLSIDILKLIDVVEKQQESHLKTLLNYRTQYKILESNSYYSYWHKMAKREIIKLRQFLTREELKYYMKYCVQAYINNKSDDIRLRNSNLRKLMYQREFLREDKQLLRHHQNKIFQEWDKLLQIVPLESLISYGLEILQEMANDKNQFFECVKNCSKLKGTKISISQDLTTVQRERYKVLRYHLNKDRPNNEQCYIKGESLYINHKPYTVVELLELDDQVKPNPRRNSAAPTPIVKESEHRAGFRKNREAEIEESQVIGQTKAEIEESQVIGQTKAKLNKQEQGGATPKKAPAFVAKIATRARAGSSSQKN